MELHHPALCRPPTSVTGLAARCTFDTALVLDAARTLAAWRNGREAEIHRLETELRTMPSAVVDVSPERRATVNAVDLARAYVATRDCTQPPAKELDPWRLAAVTARWSGVLAGCALDRRPDAFAPRLAALATQAIELTPAATFDREALGRLFADDLTFALRDCFIPYLEGVILPDDEPHIFSHWLHHGTPAPGLPPIYADRHGALVALDSAVAAPRVDRVFVVGDVGSGRRSLLRAWLERLRFAHLPPERASLASDGPLVRWQWGIGDRHYGDAHWSADTPVALSGSPAQGWTGLCAGRGKTGYLLGHSMRSPSSSLMLIVATPDEHAEACGEYPPFGAAPVVAVPPRDARDVVVAALCQTPCLFWEQPARLAEMLAHLAALEASGEPALERTVQGSKRLCSRSGVCETSRRRSGWERIVTRAHVAQRVVPRAQLRGVTAATLERYVGSDDALIELAAFDARLEAEGWRD